MGQFETERKGPGRRTEDQECVDHGERLNTVERKLSWQKGAFFVACACLGVFLSITGWLGQQIYDKVSSIEKIMVTEQVSKAEMMGEVRALAQRVTVIENRHVYEDQNRRR